MKQDPNKARDGKEWEVKREVVEANTHTPTHNYITGQRHD